MDTKEINIQIPDGYEIDKKHSTFEKIIFKKKIGHFSKNWEEFCINNPIAADEVCIDANFGIVRLENMMGDTRVPRFDNNMIPEKFGKAMLALMQLLTIREKEYTKGWEPDWKDNSTNKYVIQSIKDHISNGVCGNLSFILSFPTKDLRDKFKETWRELLEIAKPLL